MTLSDTLAALSEAATQDNPWFYGEPEVGLEPEPFFGKPLECGMRPLQPMTRQDAEFVTALWTAYRTGQLVPALSDPNAVHANMLRGTIAKPSGEAIWHIYGASLLDAMPDDIRGQLVPVPSVERVSKAVHEALCRVDVMRYLDLPPQTAENIAMIVIAAMQEGRAPAP